MPLSSNVAPSALSPRVFRFESRGPIDRRPIEAGGRGSGRHGGNSGISTLFNLTEGEDLTLRSKSLLVLALALGTVVSGCGGGSDEEENTTISTSSISKAEFIEQANAICKPGKAKLLSEILAYQKKHLNEASVKVVPNAARKVMKPALQAEVEEIRGLGAPQGDAQEIEKFFTSLLKGVDEIIAKKPPTFEEAERMLQQAGDNARRYGIDECEYALVDEAFNRRVLNSG
jgi:hypothetical protein